ncbi:class I SAM-dependent methyltransferase [Cryptosporangium minutisporangium]|uniref:Class I SAM-dependent methyltransferase n=1 Tax=Cryptosporangium minutisporangium TaxID=113569 RepID=A0ABP6SYV5_9ACTN
MTQIVNTGQAEAWNGYEGTHWASNADRYDAVNSGYNQSILEAAALAPGDDVLDVGCGNGQLTRLAGAAIAPGSTLGIDLSAPMLATARARTAASTVQYVRGDAQVYPFEPASRDVVLSRFGVMFFADPVAAFANIRRALRPGGRMAFACLRGVAGTELGTVFEAMTRPLPPSELPTGTDGTGPTSLADPDRIRQVLTAAGFSNVRTQACDAEQIWGHDVADAAAFLGAWGPVRHQLSQVDAATAEAVTDALTEALRPFERDGAVRLRGGAWLVTAVTR